MSTEFFLGHLPETAVEGSSDGDAEVVLSSLETNVLAEPSSQCGHDKSAGLSERYLTGKLTEDDVQLILEHLQKCQECQEQKNAELVIRSLLRQCCQGDKAPAELRVRIQHISIATA